MDVGVEVVRATGRCNAGFKAGETFTLDGSRLVPAGHDAAGARDAGPGRGEARDCPVDPGTGAGGNVLFRVWTGSGEEVRAARGQAVSGPAVNGVGETPVIKAAAVEVLGFCPAGLRGGIQ